MGCVEEMNEKQWTWWDLLVALLIAAIVVAEMWLTIKIQQVDEDTERVEAIMVEAQKRIDNYLGSLPAQERPAETSAPTEADDAPVVTVIAPEEPEIPAWYIEDLPLNQDLQEALWNACALSVIEQETDYQNLRGDGGNSIGFFQIQPRWWGELMERIGTDDLADPVDNFRTGCAVLRELLLRYDGSVTDALTAYNSGHPGESAYADAVMEAAKRWRER